MRSIFAALAISAVLTAAPQAQAAVPEIHVGNYYFSPKTVRLRVNSSATLVFISDGGTYALAVPQIGLNPIKIRRGEPVTVTVTPTTVGTFVGRSPVKRCTRLSVNCRRHPPVMQILFIVE